MRRRAFQGQLVPEAILADQDLVVERVYRHGPRYWVGRVRRGKEVLVLKTVINDEPWQDGFSGQTFWPSDQLRVEIAMTRLLGEAAGELQGDIARLVAWSDTRPSWLLRTLVPGRSLAACDGPFLFEPEFFQGDQAGTVVDYILSYQRMAPKLLAHLRLLPGADRLSLAARLASVHVLTPHERLRELAAAVRSYAMARQRLYDDSPTTIMHSQVFPPHIFVTDGRPSLIDWEGARTSHALEDVAALWVRGYAQTAWQSEFMALLKRKELIATALDEHLWHLEALLQVFGNLDYLYWSRAEPEAERRAAIAVLERQAWGMVQYDEIKETL